MRLVDGARRLLLRLEALMRSHGDESDEFITKHEFAGDVYARSLYLPKGSCVVGKLHKREHIAELTSGEVQVYDEEFGSRRIVAPYQFVSAPGTKRAIYAREDSVWTTYHENTDGTQDLAQLEARLIASDYKELNYELDERGHDGRERGDEVARRRIGGIGAEHSGAEQSSAGIA